MFIDRALFCAKVMSLICTPVASSNKALGKVLSKKIVCYQNSLLFQTYKTSLEESAPCVPPREESIPGSSGMPGCCHGWAQAQMRSHIHDASPVLWSCNAECWAGSSHGTLMFNKVLHMEGQLLQRGKAAVPAAPAFCSNGGTEYPTLVGVQALPRLKQ